MKEKTKKDNKLNQYPCNVYLQNALRFITEKNMIQLIQRYAGQ